MCPMCIATAVWIAGSVTGAGGLTALAVKKLGARSDLIQVPEQIQSKESHDDQHNDRS